MAGEHPLPTLIPLQLILPPKTKSESFYNMSRSIPNKSRRTHRKFEIGSKVYLNRGYLYAEGCVPKKSKFVGVIASFAGPYVQVIQNTYPHEKLEYYRTENHIKHWQLLGLSEDKCIELAKRARKDYFG